MPQCYLSVTSLMTISLTSLQCGIRSIHLQTSECSSNHSSNYAATVYHHLPQRDGNNVRTNNSYQHIRPSHPPTSQHKYRSLLCIDPTHHFPPLHPFFPHFASRRHAHHSTLVGKFHHVRTQYDPEHRRRKPHRGDLHTTQITERDSGVEGRRGGTGFCARSFRLGTEDCGCDIQYNE